VAYTPAAVLVIGLLVLLITFGLDAAVDNPVAPSAQSARARLTITTMNLLQAAGRGFEAGERVVVSIGTRRRAVTAEAHSRFTARFGRATCSGGTITAVGSKGSRAVVRLPRTACAAP
jgi:hypothetical protein